MSSDIQSQNSSNVYDTLYGVYRNVGQLDAPMQFNQLPEGLRNQIYGQIYELANRPLTNDPEWGRNHAFRDLPRLQQAIQRVVFNVFPSMSTDQRNAVCGRVYEYSGRPQTTDPQWGENHVFDDVDILFRSLMGATYSDTNTDQRIGAGVLQPALESKLTKQMRLAQEQMNREPVKSFLYSTAPTNWQQETVNGFAGKKTVGNLSVGICHAQGRRPTMEDQHLAVQFNVRIRNTEYPVQLFGVFDGHGGPMVSQFLREHLQQKVQESLRDCNLNGFTDDGISRALKMACIHLNQDLQVDGGANNQGSTATMAMILDGKLWTANVGDSRTVLDNNGRAVQLTEDANPEDPRYKKGIEKRGGQVFSAAGAMRINGIIACGGAFGDFCLNGAISASPKVTMMPLSEIQTNSHLILCCDGVYDVARTIDIVGAVHANRNLSAPDLARNIVYSAWKSGSKDNLSALVIKIR